MMDGDGMVTSLMVGSGWAGLVVCMVIGALSRLPLGMAGRRCAEGAAWGGWGAVGFGLLALAVLAGLSSLGSFFGIMGLAFAAFVVLGGVQAFLTPARLMRARQEQIAHAERLGQAWNGGRAAATTPDEPRASSSSTLLNGEPLPGSTGRGSADRRPTGEPEWYAPDESGRGDDGHGPRA